MTRVNNTSHKLVRNSQEKKRSKCPSPRSEYDEDEDNDDTGHYLRRLREIKNFLVPPN